MVVWVLEFAPDECGWHMVFGAKWEAVSKAKQLGLKIVDKKSIYDCKDDEAILTRQDYFYDGA